MKIEKIRPIPKYVLNKIEKADKLYRPVLRGNTRFYSYLSKNDGELVRIYVAAKQYRKRLYYKQIAVHGVHSDMCFIKDVAFTPLAGYIVGWYKEGLSRYPKWYEDGEWGLQYDRYFAPFAPIVNREYVSAFPEYRYSAVDKYPGMDLLKYLRLYEEFPQIEYLTKLGLHRLAFSKQILRLCGKDKRFCKWLARNRQDFALSSVYVPAVLQAYKKNRPVYELQSFYVAKMRLDKDEALKPLRQLFRRDLEKFLLYLEKQRANAHGYLDYFNACNYLGLDMTADKNRYPHDFKRWHDIRIDEYHTAKALKDEEERKAFCSEFATVAEKYLGLEYDKKSVYVAVIAHQPSDLVREGEALHHCVGRMNYDRKFVREESLIFFIRLKEAPDIPLVTVEYSLSQKRVLQCYGKHDSKPSDDVLAFVNKKWLPYANKKLKRITAA